MTNQTLIIYVCNSIVSIKEHTLNTLRSLSINVIGLYNVTAHYHICKSKVL